MGVPAELLFHPLPSHISFVGQESIVYLVFIATLLYFPLMQYGIKHTNAFTASLTGYISPLFGGSVAILVLGERITQTFIWGTVFILLGVIYSTNVKYLKKYIPVMLEYIHD
jgi:drug/metabolite transporter (DMT)-like permease